MNMRLNFGYSGNSDFIFGLERFELLILLQSRDMENLPKLISFSILGFFQLGVKLGFEFPEVVPNQKYRPRYLNFDFDEERKPTYTGLTQNSSSARSPNFPHRKLKMLGIEFRFDRKMRPSMESQYSLLLNP